MSTKNLLIIAGVAVVGYMLWKKSQPKAVASGTSNVVGGYKCNCLGGIMVSSITECQQKCEAAAAKRR